MNNYSYKFSIIIIGLLSFASKISAQSPPVIAQYFQNPFFVNPAFAGKEGGLSLNMDYSFKSNNNQGALKNQFFTADVNLKKSGLGLTLQNQENGLLSTKIAKVTYAYHLKVSENINLNFGLSSGLTQERFDFASFSMNEMNDASDPLPAEFNNRRPSFNVDFGTAITAQKFTLQISLSNLKKVSNTTQYNLADRQLYVAANYKIRTNKNSSWELEPVIAYAKSEYFKDRVDMGMRLNILDEQLGLVGIYRTDKIFSTGMSVKLTQGITIQGAYNSSFSNYNLSNNGVFEFALRANFKGNANN